MPSHSHKVTSESSMPTAPPSSTPANTCPPGLACPVSSCPLILKGETPHRYLRRHLNHPGLYGRTGQEKDVWLNLHKIEHERLLATLVEGNNTEEGRNSRTAEFELRAKSMGVAGENFVTQKVAIWEGMRATKQNGDDTGYYAWVLLDAATSADQ